MVTVQLSRLSIKQIGCINHLPVTDKDEMIFAYDGLLIINDKVNN